MQHYWKYLTLVNYWNHNKELVSKLDNLLRKTSSSEENIFVANQCVTEQNSLQLQEEVEVKFLTETLKKMKSIVIIFLR